MKILVYDFGLCTEHAIRLARDGHTVFYFVPWADAFPKSTKALIGEGLEGLTRIKNFWDYVDKVDIIAFFDTHCGDLVKYLRDKGYKVFGAGEAELLELDRIKQKEILKKVGLPVGEYKVCHGLKELREYLESFEDKYVKLNIFRGDLETFHHKDYKSSLPLLDHLAYELGAKQDQIDFIVEDTIEGVEPGYDGFVIDGNYPEITLYGYELKGAGYIGRVCFDKQLPQALRLINQKLASFFKVTNARTMFSTEVRVGEDRKGYLIDPCVRAPMPIPSAIEIEIYKNFSDIIIQGAQGKLVKPQPIAKYGVGVCLESEWAQNHWLEVEIPKEIRQWVKLRMACKIDDKYYAVPGFTSICSVIGLGNTIDEAIEKCKKRVELIDAYLIEKDVGGLEKIKEIIEEGRKFGISF